MIDASKWIWDGSQAAWETAHWVDDEGAARVGFPSAATSPTPKIIINGAFGPALPLAIPFDIAGFDSRGGTWTDPANGFNDGDSDVRAFAVLAGSEIHCKGGRWTSEGTGLLAATFTDGCALGGHGGFTTTLNMASVDSVIEISDSPCTDDSLGAVITNADIRIVDTVALVRPLWAIVCRNATVRMTKGIDDFLPMVTAVCSGNLDVLGYGTVGGTIAGRARLFGNTSAAASGTPVFGSSVEWRSKGLTGLGEFSTLDGMEGVVVMPNLLELHAQILFPWGRSDTFTSADMFGGKNCQIVQNGHAISMRTPGGIVTSVTPQGLPPIGA